MKEFYYHKKGEKVSYAGKKKQHTSQSVTLLGYSSVLHLLCVLRDRTQNKGGGEGGTKKGREGERGSS